MTLETRTVSVAPLLLSHLVMPRRMKNRMTNILNMLSFIFTFLISARNALKVLNWGMKRKTLIIRGSWSATMVLREGSMEQVRMVKKGWELAMTLIKKEGVRMNYV